MSVKRAKLQRRPRVVAAEDCPRCGAVIGQTCRSYKGRGGPPHALPMATAPQPVAAPATEKRYWDQGWLFGGPTE